MASERSWFFPSRRDVAEASTGDAVSLSGAGGGGYGLDPIDGDMYRKLGEGRGPRDVPAQTRNRSATLSIAAYRTNPMARAIIDTETSFCVGDSGVKLTASDSTVEVVAREYWDDPWNDKAGRQELRLRSHLLQGESLVEYMVGEITGVVRYVPIDPARIRSVEHRDGNSNWPTAVWVAQGGGRPDKQLTVAQPDDMTGLIVGQAGFVIGERTLETDTRGVPFLMPILDWLDDYNEVLFNLVDRSKLARYFMWDVTIEGGSPDEIQAFVDERRGKAPKSGTVEVHNDKVSWDAKNAQTGSYEDTNTTRALMTNLAAGAGLSKPWLAEPEDANRATALTMAEPVRRRISAVQNRWLSAEARDVRFAVDQAVLAGRLPAMVTIDGPGGNPIEVPASSTVHVVGPQIAAADAQVTADVLARLAQSLSGLVSANIMSLPAAQVAATKAWEDFVGVPYRPELDTDETGDDDLAAYIDDQLATQATP